MARYYSMNAKALLGIAWLFVAATLCSQELVEESGLGLPKGQYAHILTDGRYTLLADTLNRFGQGEEVEIAHDYYIGKYAVTNGEWAAFLAATRRQVPRHWVDGRIPAGRERHPVVWVSYDDALAYCDWLEDFYPGYDFRLPTQAEWEYAAVGEQRTCYPWGDDAGTSYVGGALASKFNYNAVLGAALLREPDRLATYCHKKSAKYGEQVPVGRIIAISESGRLSGWINHRDYTGLVYTDIFQEVNDAGGYTCSVNSYPEGASLSGCYNMSGNCWEWTSTVERATHGAEKGQLVNVIKGGSWYATSQSCKVSYRGEGRYSKGRYATVGFRVVAEKIKE